MKMNPLIILGILILVAGTGLGTYLMYVGSGKSSAASQKELIDKIEETQQKIEKAKGSTGSDKSKEEIEQIENEFNKWASEFIKNKDLRKLELERKEINAKGDRIALNSEWRPRYQSFFKSIKSIIDAYNKQSGAAIKYDIAALPNNVFEPSAKQYSATIDFSPNTKWVMLLTPAAPLADDPMPRLKVSILDSTENNAQDQFNIFIVIDTFMGQERKQILIGKYDNNRFNMSNISKSYDIDEDAFKVLAKDLMESQLLQL